jgi:hypothetical protein
LKFQLQKLGGHSPQAEPQFTQIGDDKIIGSTRWLDDGGRRIERYQVITFSDGKITDLQGCSSRREAQRFARRH